MASSLLLSEFQVANQFSWALGQQEKEGFEAVEDLLKDRRGLRGKPARERTVGND